VEGIVTVDSIPGEVGGVGEDEEGEEEGGEA
jgi:hypothetical protein